ncbi:MAG TPA: AAA family ATPase [Marinilabiliales bacterium]|nr:MAG: AAA family ATPase [Bacteroidetes bacterium GWC2_40_13]OFX73253.1 MAG: AAA family ATPase [Bacteroidetes bacterium GWD2_40_43]OFX92108.1 MAG: AAA family ATPase [Bacteroidetes bacterium GWE2_40_63]OFY16732.1 MAG: AAA family ATPase [Bacteroidetes bacterium GWF2_40_13]OFZ30628.1 MAG: AAA family ATPase [Bacteroidetes bacterium RIFOXYC2_FULL_40_12]HAM98951.1 AAA family ATPase [Marinilabiliales bacterium]
MIKREAENELRYLATQFKAVAVVGPRQSGKTTLVRMVFEGKAYVSLENPDIRRFAMEDPRGFLYNYPNGAILDEIQRVPHLFSYLQQVLDERASKGQFILTGSNNFLLQESISQSLAGRVGYLFLLPLSMNELKYKDEIDFWLYKGGYPVLHQEETETSRFYANYIRTYIERDVRLLKNISDLYAFERFLRLCAGRIGQLLNMSNLAVEVGVDTKTIGAWLAVLETSFILFRLQPFHESYNKRIVKMPKIYFYDTGLACALLGVENQKQLALNPFRGHLFENAVIVELLKRRLNNGKTNNLFFWRDNVGNEIDVLVVMATEKLAIEIKSGQTISNEYFKGIQFWNKITQTGGGLVVYGGELVQRRSNGIQVVPLTELYANLDDLEKIESS